jgi:hypothetical protein
MCEVVCIRIIRIISKKSLFYLNVHLRSISNTCTVLAVFIVHLLSINIQGYIIDHGLRSVVSIATSYGLDGPGIESQWGRDFLHLSRPALGPTHPPVQWVLGLSQGVKSGRGMKLTPHPSSSAVVMKE